MNETATLHGIIGRATMGVLILLLTFFGIAMNYALLGFGRIAESAAQVGFGLSIIFGALFVAFMVSSLVGGICRRLDRGDTPQR